VTGKAEWLAVECHSPFTIHHSLFTAFQ